VPAHAQAQQAAPEVAAPEATTPEVTASEAQATPEVAALETQTAPEAVTPEAPEAVAPEAAVPDAIAPDVSSLELGAGRARFEAGRVKYAGSVATIEANEGEVVRVRSGNAQIQAKRVEIDMATKTLKADGEVLVERRITAVREMETPIRNDRREVDGDDTDALDDLNREAVGNSTRLEPFTERVRGENLSFDGRTQTGSIDKALLQLESFDVSSARIEILGSQYTARGVVLRPSGLSEEEKRIYGTPPFTLRARRLTVTRNEGGGGQIAARGAALYFKSTRLLPIPAAVFSSFARFGPSRGVATYRIVPRISLNSADGFLATARISFPLAGFPTPAAPASGEGPRAQVKPRRAVVESVLNTDLGFSQKIGFRGGLSLDNRTPVGLITLRARRADVITTQLTSRIQLDRKPEISFDTPVLTLVRPRAGRKGVGVGAYLSASAGRYSEKLIGQAPRVDSSRYSATAVVTTRVSRADGFYADLFHANSRYSATPSRYKDTGFEVGYAGQVLPRVQGLFSYRHSSLSGATPFRFDLVEIPRELRATFDVQLSPRYILPLDLRYDLDRGSLRDKSFGILRSYKNLAYGVVYQTARRDLRLDIRTNF